MNFYDIFDVKCDNGVNEPVTISIKGVAAKLMAGNLGVWCTKTLIRKEIIKQQYKYALIFEDDFAPNPENFLEEFNRFINDLPKNWDIAYLYCFITGNKFFKNITSTVQSPDYQGKLPNWWGDWAHAISYSGAIKLTFGDHKYYGPSDEFSKNLAKGIVKKPFVDHFNAYFATHNFSKYSPITYTGHHRDSISTKMGCRDHHESDPADCINKNISINDVVNLVGLIEEDITI